MPQNDGFPRRRALNAIGAAAVFAACRALAQAPRSAACVLTPAQTEGPYFVDERLARADIRVDPTDGSVRRGAMLTLSLRVSAIGDQGCAPLEGALVDLWHCDAAGIYSDADGMRVRSKGSKFLRGYQITDTDGRVRFTTIYPGAYPGRAVHIHFKVRTKARGRTREFTSQFYFDDALTDRVHSQPPYAGADERRTRNTRWALPRQRQGVAARHHRRRQRLHVGVRHRRGGVMSGQTRAKSKTS